MKLGGRVVKKNTNPGRLFQVARPPVRGDRPDTVTLTETDRESQKSQGPRAQPLECNRDLSPSDLSEALATASEVLTDF